MTILWETLIENWRLNVIEVDHVFVKPALHAHCIYCLSFHNDYEVGSPLLILNCRAAFFDWR